MAYFNLCESQRQPSELEARQAAQDEVSFLQDPMAKKHTKQGAQAPNTKKPRDDWHTMFYGALELILDSKLFSYDFEHELTKEPLQIDAIIVKKLRDVESAVKIAKLFLRYNIIEFKGPGDYISIEDFYKVLAYAFLYRSTIKTASIREMTLTFVEKHYPMKLIKHLEEELNYRVEMKWPGIYYAFSGLFPFPIQLIVTKGLEDEENIWLRHLDKGLGVEELSEVLHAVYDDEKREAHTRYIKPLAQANMATVQEMSKMAELTFDEFMEDWVMNTPRVVEHVALRNGFIPAAVFEAERQKAAAERQKAEAERAAERQNAVAERQKAETERQKAAAEWQKAAAERQKAVAERQKTILKLHEKNWTDSEIAELMELDLKTIQTYIAGVADHA
jgi:hypothetical protein